MGTGRRASAPWAMHPPPRRQEPPRCRPPPDWRYHPKSQPRCARDSTAPGRALGGRSLSSCCVRRAVTRRRWRPCGWARAPAWTVSSARIAQGAAAYGSRQTVSAPSPCGRPAGGPGSHDPWAPDSTPPPVPRAGAARGGGGPAARRRSRPPTASRSRRPPGAAGSTRGAGWGNGPSWWPKMPTRTGASGWRVCGCRAQMGRRRR